MPGAERSVAERIQEALAYAGSDTGGISAERPSVAALCRRAGISRNTLYRFYPEALHAIRRLRHRAEVNTAHVATIRRLRADLAGASTLSRHLATLVDHYAAAYQEARELLDQRDRELAELRRSRGSLPTVLRRKDAHIRPNSAIDETVSPTMR